jgi:hypothetical protein
MRIMVSSRAAASAWARVNSAITAACGSGRVRVRHNSTASAISAKPPSTLAAITAAVMFSAVA